MPIYKTPGVYIEEIPKFPPSIAAVETAIPAFIGYTEKAIRNGESLTNKPTRIESIAEYEAWFGSGPLQDVTVTLDSNNNFVKAEATAKFYLYDSLRMFYANGGGNCYIVSVGDYSATIVSAEINKGLESLKQEDEPTIIACPDTVSDANILSDFQEKSLQQCQDLKDRVVICDLAASKDKDEFNKKVVEFRSKVGINHLKYGIAYGPWIQANLPRKIWHKNLKLNPPSLVLKSLTTDANIHKLIDTLVNTANGIEGLTASIKNLEVTTVKPNSSFEDELKALEDTFKIQVDNASNIDVGTELKSVSSLAIGIVAGIADHYKKLPDPSKSEFKAKNDIETYIKNSDLKQRIEILTAHHHHLSMLAAEPIEILTTGADLDKVAVLLGVPGGSTLLSAEVPSEITNAYTSATTAKERGDIAIKPIVAFANSAITLFRFVQATYAQYEKTLNDALLASFGKFKELTTKAAEALNTIPPSGAIAGVYASVDRDRGVWKAPANVSLNGVIGPAVQISAEQQAEYNVDTNAGKSINIIRSFTGKGTLVWGARTLAGNDNEWRYVNVRRFFNFVEESVKKATEAFVFEPNDANTWVRVQGMIENFLTTLWRQGALQGVKPEHAFYVAVGLGKTMTAFDILEGRMIIEIGMAAVRPAEFIILKFSHKMPES